MAGNGSFEMKATGHDIDEVENGSGTGEKTLVSQNPSDSGRPHIHSLEVCAYSPPHRYLHYTHG
jgi:hypothetical protein